MLNAQDRIFIVLASLLSTAAFFRFCTQEF
jgi:hypothetical protein